LTNDAVQTYTYDLNGNRTMAGYVTGGANELTADGVWTYTYDKNGNLTQKAKVGETVTYTYDVRNRLVGAQDTTTGLQMQATYVYDALGRIEKDVWQLSTSSVATTRFLYDRSEIWADLNQNNALAARYLRGDRVLALLAWIPGSGASGLSFALPVPLGLVHAAPNSPVRWVLGDRMGSVRQVLDGSGTLIGTVVYDGYGNVTSASNPLLVPKTGRVR
jgi:VCBS repeat-containing protein